MRWGENRVLLCKDIKIIIIVECEHRLSLMVSSALDGHAAPPPLCTVYLARRVAEWRKEEDAGGGGCESQNLNN